MSAIVPTDLSTWLNGLDGQGGHFRISTYVLFTYFNIFVPEKKLNFVSWLPFRFTVNSIHGKERTAFLRQTPSTLS